MLKELNHTIKVIEMNITQKDIGLTKDKRTVSYAMTNIKGNICVNYQSDKGISTILTNVDVEAKGDDCWSLHAVVGVEIHYEGNIEKPSQSLMDKVEFRLEEIAQGYCMKEVRKELFEKNKQK